MRIYKGDMFYTDLTPVVGCEQGGIRPVLIIQNDIGNCYSPTVCGRHHQPHGKDLSAYPYSVVQPAVRTAAEFPCAFGAGANH